MANQERVVFIAEVRDEATADLDKINKSIYDTTKKVEDSGKRTERSTSRSTTALERFSSGGSKAFQRFSGGMRTHLDRGMGALGDLGKRISESDTVIGRMVRGGTKGLQDFASGFKSPLAAASSFTGVMGTLGGAVRSGMDSIAGIASSVGSAIQSAIAQVGELGARMQDLGPKVSGVGGTLTKAITLPAAGAAAAVGGITAKLGWDRLTSLDSAQAQLRGLGYESQDVERITGDLVATLEGGMMTMGDATSTAAGALAAGVSEGAELERYIQLVDAAAVGMGRSVDETAMIFGRVQGSGKLMTQELNMIEQYMPGFAAAMSDSLGVGQDEFRSLVTEGEISSNQFMDVMDSFAGGMATEYAASWEGMLANTKNYIGILGESLLGGVFEQSKESIAKFVDFLASDEVAAWATSVGESIGNAFETAIGWVQSAIEWWTNLDGSTQRLIGIIAGIAVALGPVLLIIGKTITVVGALLSRIGTMGAAVTEAGGVMSILRQGLGRVATALRFVTGPIGLLIAGLIAAWTYSEDFREAIVNMGLAIWDAITQVWDALQPMFSGLGSGLSWLGDVVAWLGALLGDALAWAINAVVIPAIEWLGDALSATIGWLVGLGDETTEQGSVMSAVWEWIQTAISATVEWITGTAWPMMQAAWEGIVAGAVWLWEGIQAVWDGIVNGAQWLWEVLQGIFIMVAAVFLWVGETLWNIWTNYIKLVWDTWVTIVSWVWEEVLQPIFGFIASAFEMLGEAFTWVWENVIKPVFDFLVEMVTWIWEAIIQPIFQFIVDAFIGIGETFQSVWENVLKPVFDFFGAVITWLWENMIQPYFQQMGESWQLLAGWFTTVWEEYLQPVLQWFGDTITGLYTNYVSPAIDWIVEKWDSLAGWLSSIWENNIKPAFDDVRDFFTETIPGWVETGVEMIAGAWDWVKGAFAEPINWVIDFVWNNGIKAAFDNVADAVGYTGSRPGKIGLIGGGNSAGGSATSGRGGGSTSYAAFAEGGLAPRGWALVGEEGPELVNFSQPGRVYTASQTRDALSGNAGGIGSPLDAVADFGSRTWDQLTDWGSSAADHAAETGRKALGWVRGNLAWMAEQIIDPMVDRAKTSLEGAGQMGRFGADLIDWGVGNIMDWIRGHDQVSVGGSYDGVFVANPGGFNRPAQGPITSRAGARSYVGAFGNMHYGVDIGNSIGSAVRAAWSGVVRSVSGGGLNRTMVLNHGGYDTAYMHNSAHLVSPGDTVTGGQQIARMGTAGTGPHLHFEYHPGGYYNPSIAMVNSLFDDGGVLGTGTTIAQNNTGLPEFVLTNRRFGQVEDALDYVSAHLPMPAHSSGGGDTINIDRRNIVSENAVNITVENTGHGFMTPEGLDEIKEAFEEILQESQRRDY